MHFLVTASPLFENGSLKGSVHFMRNITAQKEAAAELIKYRDNLEEMVKDRTAELDKRTQELEKLNRLFVDREFRIKELTDRVKELEKK